MNDEHQSRIWFLWSLSYELRWNSSHQNMTLLYGGSNFWSSKVCEGGESREAYACKLTFGPPQFLFEINDHVTKTLTFISSNRIINFEEKLVWIKSESACICFTWLTSFTYFTGPKVGPRVRLKKSNLNLAPISIKARLNINIETNFVIFEFCCCLWGNLKEAIWLILYG